jgi:CIC family chloride channel protein
MIDLLHQPIIFLRKRFSDRQFLIISSILVGVTSGFAAIVLKYMVHSIGQLVNYTQRSEEFLVIAIFPLLGILLTAFFTKFFLNGSLKKGSASIVYSIIKKSSLIPFRNTYAHLATSALTVGFGGSLGLESPMVSTGAAIGSNYGRTYTLSYKDRTILLGCGAAAGIAAAFNSPIAGVLFSIEVLLTEIAASAFIPLIIAAACGALLSKMVLAEGVTLAFTLQQPFDYNNVPYYVALGLICGLISITYTKLFEKIEHAFEKFPDPWTRAIIGGLILFSIIAVFPPLFGEGYQSVQALERLNAESLTERSILQTVFHSEGLVVLFVVLLVFFKIIAAAVTIGGGGNGGSFAPSLVVGSYVGFVFARTINWLGVTTLPISNFTLVAMAGILSGVFYAPLTAIFLIAEITGGYDLMIPLMIVASLSLLISHIFEPTSLESRKLSLMLKSTVENRDKLLLSRLNLTDLIETNFSVIRHDGTLSDLVKVISSSTRNTFPVVDQSHKLAGIIHLDKIRSIMFDHSKHESVTVRELMDKPTAIVELHENLFEVLMKFEQTSQWNLPVVEDELYLGFVSKSSILTRYRRELMEFV